MLHEHDRSVSRRVLLRNSGLAAGGILLGAARKGPASDGGPLPTRVLGRTGLAPTCFTLGTAPLGFADKISLAEAADVVRLAMDQGVTSIDTAPKYVRAEEIVGMALGRRRKDVILATKVWADTIAEAEESFSQSLRLLKTDYVDILYYHCLGVRDVEKARKPDGVFTWLLKQKKAGKVRFAGVSGHSVVDRYEPFLAGGDVDVLLVVVNLADRHTYNFEEKVVPAAVRQNVGVVAMKVLGGASRKAGGYKNPDAAAEMPSDLLNLSVRYAMSVPGVATLNIGVHNRKQLLADLEMVRSYRPLSIEEQHKVAELGRPLAAQWGAHFGPA